MQLEGEGAKLQEKMEGANHSKYAINGYFPVVELRCCLCTVNARIVNHAVSIVAKVFMTDDGWRR